MHINGNNVMVRRKRRGSYVVSAGFRLTPVGLDHNDKVLWEWDLSSAEVDEQSNRPIVHVIRFLSV